MPIGQCCVQLDPVFCVGVGYLSKSVSSGVTSDSLVQFDPSSFLSFLMNVVERFSLKRLKDLSFYFSVFFSFFEIGMNFCHEVL